MYVGGEADERGKSGLHETVTISGVTHQVNKSAVHGK